MGPGGPRRTSTTMNAILAYLDFAMNEAIYEMFGVDEDYDAYVQGA